MEKNLYLGLGRSIKFSPHTNSLNTCIMCIGRFIRNLLGECRIKQFVLCLCEEGDKVSERTRNFKLSKLLYDIICRR